MSGEKIFNDEEIIEAIQSGPATVLEQALKYLYKTHYYTVDSLVRQNSGYEADVADVFQDSIVILYDQIKLGTFRGDCSIKTYLYAIARNLWLRNLKKSSNRLTDLVDVINAPAEEITPQIDMSETGILSEIIDNLNADCRDILTDFYYKNKTMKEIMDRFHLGSEQAAKNKKYRCLKNLIRIVKERKLSMDMLSSWKTNF